MTESTAAAGGRRVGMEPTEDIVMVVDAAHLRRPANMARADDRGMAESYAG